eukprot:jgi/Tetstr1/439065/TSEL_027555.t1
MYDFCFSFPYAALLALGGVMGYATKGSTASLGVGLASAGVIALCGYVSLMRFHSGKTCKPATAMSLLLSAALTYVMRMRYNQTGKFMPAGLTMGLSGLMALFYTWSLLAGPTPPSKAA